MPRRNKSKAKKQKQKKYLTKRDIKTISDYVSNSKSERFGVESNVANAYWRGGVNLGWNW